MSIILQKVKKGHPLLVFSKPSFPFDQEGKRLESTEFHFLSSIFLLLLFLTPPTPFFIPFPPGQ